ncbi:pilus assembly protein CpaF [Leucobacter zeae]|nr:pilus assembly protein CpaF [Leucobacter zeae]
MANPEAHPGAQPNPTSTPARRALAGFLREGREPREAGHPAGAESPEHGPPGPARPVRGLSAGDDATTAAPSAPLRTGVLGPAARRAFGGLLPLLDDPGLRDLFVQVRGGAGRLWVDRGASLQAVPGWRADPSAVRSLATGLIAAGGRHLDELHPYADVRLGDGIRVHAVLPPVAVDGAAVSVRVPGGAPPEFGALARGGLCGQLTARWLANEVRGRRNLLVTGGTGSGKTTLLSAMLGLVPHGERILTIEDVAELRIDHPHVVSLEARQPNAEGAGEVPLDRLLREALRMRPDRIVLGECRGAEIATLLTALNTGHDGGAGTLHASRLAEVPARLEALGALAGLGPDALGRQAVSALHAVVHLERGPRGHRIAAIGRLGIGASGVLEITEVRM